MTLCLFLGRTLQNSNVKRLICGVFNFFTNINDLLIPNGRICHDKPMWITFLSRKKIALRSSMLALFCSLHFIALKFAHTAVSAGLVAQVSGFNPTTLIEAAVCKKLIH